MVSVRSIRKYMSTENEALGATVILNTPGTPGVVGTAINVLSHMRSIMYYRPGLRVSSADEGDT